MWCISQVLFSIQSRVFSAQTPSATHKGSIETLFFSLTVSTLFLQQPTPYIKQTRPKENLKRNFNIQRKRILNSENVCTATKNKVLSIFVDFFTKENNIFWFNICWSFFLSFSLVCMVFTWQCQNFIRFRWCKIQQTKSRINKKKEISISTYEIPNSNISVWTIIKCL